MIGTHVVPDRSSTMGTHQLHLTWFTYNCCTESYTPSRPNTNNSTITLHAELLFIWTACDIVPNIAKEIQNNR